jgi:predicted nucleotidyltransferase
MNNVSPEIQARIVAELEAVERNHAVEIVLAVESGSRAWGFPSLDSDYDVRFLYVRPHDAYLSAFAASDVIAHALDAVLDVNGWDLQKALRLMAGSNPTLMEWLTSPLRYRPGGTVITRLLDLAREVAHLPSFAYHYDRLARRSFGEIGGAERVRVKAYCYALRAVLALAWIRERRSPPPMDLPSLLGGTSIAAGLQGVIDALVRQKAQATEKDLAARSPDLDRLIAGILAVPEVRPQPIDRPDVRAAIDRFFLDVLGGPAEPVNRPSRS